MALFEVLSDYTNDNLNPVELLKGDTVQLGELSDPDGPYPNWIFCTSNQSDQKGQVPVHILIIDKGTGTATKDYTSKEMAVTTGDIVGAIYELNGWYWCVRKADNETGWVAKDNLKKKYEHFLLNLSKLWTAFCRHKKAPYRRFYSAIGSFLYCPSFEVLIKNGEAVLLEIVSHDDRCSDCNIASPSLLLADTICSAFHFIIKGNGST